MRPWLPILALLLATLPSASAASSHVHIQGFAFSPTPVTVAAGDTVTWDNHDSAPHTVSSTDGKFSGSSTLAKDATFSRTFSAPGTYNYRCNIHTSMTGTVTVQASTTNEAPSISIASPAEGSVVSGTTSIAGTASDADGNTLAVEVRVDSGPWRPASGGVAWSFDWNTTQVVNGTHTLTARVSDGTTTIESAARTVTVRNAGGETPAARFLLANLSAPLTGTVGTPFNVSADVRNAGALGGTTTLQFLVTGTPRETKSVTLGAQERSRVAFQFTPLTPGNLSVTIGLVDGDALPARTIAVASKEATGSDKTNAPGSAGTPGAGTLLFLCSVALALALAHRRRREA